MLSSGSSETVSVEQAPATSAVATNRAGVRMPGVQHAPCPGNPAERHEVAGRLAGGGRGGHEHVLLVVPQLLDRLADVVERAVRVLLARLLRDHRRIPAP